MATLRIFELPRSTQANARPEPKEIPSVEVQGEGDVAKRAARAALIEAQFDVRSLNWGPSKTPGKAPELIAYVTKKEKV